MKKFKWNESIQKDTLNIIQIYPEYIGLGITVDYMGYVKDCIIYVRKLNNEILEVLHKDFPDIDFRMEIFP